MRKRKKRRVAFRFYVLLFVAVCVVGYGGYLAVDSLVRRTAVIESGNMGNQYTARAVIVRDETLTDVEGLTSVVYYADEGEMVYRGSKIAEVYSSGYSQTDMNKLLNTRSEIKQLHKTLNASYNDQQLDRMDAQIAEYAAEVRSLAQGRTDGNLLNLERQIQSALTSRQSYLKSRHMSDTNLQSLYDTESSLLKKNASWTITYLADEDCIVSFYTDGYENTLTVDGFDEITAQQTRDVLNGVAPEQTSAQRGRTPVFRKVRAGGWYLLLLSEDKNWNPVVGQSYKVELEGFDDQVVDATVTSFARSGGELLVRMSVSSDVRVVLNVRTANAQVGELYVSGLKVPLNALRQQNGQMGIVLTDDGGRFVPVTVIMQDNSYAVIQPLQAGALMEKQKIRVF